MVPQIEAEVVLGVRLSGLVKNASRSGMPLALESAMLTLVGGVLYGLENAVGPNFSVD